MEKKDDKDDLNRQIRDHDHQIKVLQEDMEKYIEKVAACWKYIVIHRKERYELYGRRLFLK